MNTCESCKWWVDDWERDAFCERAIAKLDMSERVFRAPPPDFGCTLWEEVPTPIEFEARIHPRERVDSSVYLMVPPGTVDIPDRKYKVTLEPLEG